MPRLLSIDYGKKRTGIAVTDILQITPGGLCTIATHELPQFLRDYISREDVSEVIIGLPTQTNGQPSENQDRVLQFSRWFKRTFPNIPLHHYDERFTSVLAHQALLQSGVPKMRRRDKGLIDEISATIILQDFMLSRQSQQPLTDTLL